MLLNLLLFLACSADDGALATPCIIDAPVATPAEAAPGAAVSLAVDPVSTVWDTLVLVGPARASVSDVLRTGCDACDTCREDNECAVCGSCEACEADCEACVGSVEIVVPAVDPGTWPVTVTSYYGTSTPTSLVVTGGAAGDSGDSGDSR